MLKHSPNLFAGKTLTCAICAKTIRNEANVESNWRMLELDEKQYYVCPDHFPPDTATAEQFKQAYIKVIRKLMAIK